MACIPLSSCDQKLMKKRLSAFLLHLFISSLIALVTVFIVFYIWYPIPLHEAVGVTEIFLILLAVDITIGPVMTLIVYKPNKPSLKFDLTIIAILQLAALGYGVNTVFAGRPAFIVFSKDRFEIAKASDIDPVSANKALEKGNESAIAGWAQPRWVGAVASLDPKRNQEILFSSLQGGPDWPQLPELFVPLSQVKEQMLARSRSIDELHKLQRKNGNEVNLDDWKDSKWLPLRSKVKNLVVLIDAGTADVIKILDIDPWTVSASK
jgi:hypothetical protein